jgi:hypothetical protein
MATMNGVTPEQMAKDIVTELEDKLVSVSGLTFQKLTAITRYLNRDKISGRSEAWFTKNFDSLVTDAITEIVEARHKQLVKYLASKENADKRGAFVELLARGVAFKDAVKQTGYNPDLDTDK